MTTRASRGIATVTSLRLCSRAPETTIWPGGDISPQILGSRRTEPPGPGRRERESGSAGRRRLQLARQVGHEWLDREVLAGRALQQLSRRIRATGLVHRGAQPLAQQLEVALGDRVVDPWDVGAQALPELCRDEAAERIGREVADQAAAPVDVLQDAVGVVGHLAPEEPLEALVPRRGHV